MPLYERAQTAFLLLEKDWENLCQRYLPVFPEDSLWKFSRQINPDDPEQGWKIHISATILTATKILEKVAPFLCGNGVLFKAPTSLQEVKKINCGLFYGFSQVGKIITVYPGNADIAVSIAQTLHGLTFRFRSPTVPYDVPFQQPGCVYYRYGSFKTLAIVNPDGSHILAVRDPTGTLVPDLRQPGYSVPNWVVDPFPQHRQTSMPVPVATPLKTTFRAYDALFQRGKGGVYRALDLSVAPARLCVIKEGRRRGETDLDGRDGYWRVKHEENILRVLHQAGVKVPEVYASFEVEGHYYLAMELITGQNLQSLLTKAKKIPIAEALRYGIQVAKLLERIHSDGWVWRDCKPLNLIVTKRKTLRPIDFEGACRIDLPDPMPWGTTGYVPPEWIKGSGEGSRKSEDLYALGATLYQLLTGRIPDVKNPPIPLGTLRRKVPSIVRKIISELLNTDPRSRPDAYIVVRALKSVIQKQSIGQIVAASLK